MCFIIVISVSECVFCRRVLRIGVCGLSSCSPDRSVCLSLSSRDLLLGSQDGRVHVWGSDSGQKMTVLEGNLPGPIQCIGFNPKYMMLANACNNKMVCENWLLGELRHEILHSN